MTTIAVMAKTTRTIPKSADGRGGYGGGEVWSNTGASAACTFESARSAWEICAPWCLCRRRCFIAYGFYPPSALPVYFPKTVETQRFPYTYSRQIARRRV